MEEVAIDPDHVGKYLDHFLDVAPVAAAALLIIAASMAMVWFLAKKHIATLENERDWLRSLIERKQ